MIIKSGQYQMNIELKYEISNNQFDISYFMDYFLIKTLKNIRSL